MERKTDRQTDRRTHRQSDIRKKKTTQGSRLQAEFSGCDFFEVLQDKKVFLFPVGKY